MPQAACHTRAETGRLRRNVNGLFTATSKKLALGRRTGPPIHPPLKLPVPTRVNRTLTVSTSDVGVSMKFGFPWSVKGIRPEARHTAFEAARRAGLPLNDWLNATILRQAEAQGIKISSLARSGDEGQAEDLYDLHQRLDDLTHRIDQLTETGFAAYAPKRNREEPYQFAELFESLEQRFDQIAANFMRQASHPARANASAPDVAPDIAPDFDRAIPEATASGHTVNGEPQPAHAQQSIPVSQVPMPPQDLSGLEDKLRRITDQIETLRHPGVEQAITALRTELGDISRKLNDAMPRRAIEIIETQVQSLSQRVAEGRQAGADSNALAGVERGLAEVRDAVRDLTPAENLIGYTDAIEALAHKIDLIVSERDPATMQQLERSLATLREMAAHVASNETISSLSTQVRALADKIDHLATGGGSDAINKLELRIDALSRAVTDRAQNGDVLPSRLEGLLQSLSEKIEQVQQTRSDEIAVSHLEDCIAKLVERLNATDSRLNNLDAIERGLADLLVHIEDIRANRESTALRAENSANIDLLKHDMARAQGTLEAVHGTLGQVADRLAIIEKDIRADRPEPAKPEAEILDLMQPADKTLDEVAAIASDAAVRAAQDAPSPTPSPAAAPQSSAPVFQPSSPLLAELSNLGVRPANLPAIESASPADQPLEPGSGAPRLATHPGVRIAASEAALGVARPSTAARGGKSDFIAAARRAAQAAGQDPNGRQTRPAYLKAKGGEPAPVPPKVMTRIKKMVLAASIVAIIVGSIQFASNIFNFGIFDTSETKLTSSPEPDLPNSDTSIAAETTAPAASPTLADGNPAPSSAPAAKAADADITSSLLAPPTLPSLTPAAPSGSPTVAAPAPVVRPRPGLEPTAQASPPASNSPPLSAPLPGSAPATKNDVTGSIARAPADVSASRQPAPTAQPVTDGLPVSIGGARLRNAAVAGDPAAAYEVAMRFMEGRGVPANLEEAARWFERAASKGLVPGQFRYASMLEKGQGVRKDLAAAQKLYVAAASKGHAKAMHNLAVLYAEGVDGKPDYVNAAQWFRRAAEHGVADSQYNLGVLTARGLGTEKNIAESYKWFALAAAQGDRDAARKRDDVAAYLNAQTLESVQEAVKSFALQAQPAEAIVVPAPTGGWDRATPPSREKPRSAGPLSLSDFSPGKL